MMAPLQISIFVALPLLIPAGQDFESLAGAAQRLAQDVAWLADDARQGRRAGTSGEGAAAEWLAARLKELALEPAGSQGFLQSFEVPLAPRDGGTSDLVVHRNPPQDSSGSLAEQVIPLTESAAGSAEGPLLFRGFGIVDEDRSWDDYGVTPVSGAIVMLIEGHPNAQAEPAGAEQVATPHGPTVVSGGGWGASASTFHKLMNARRRGAVAVLLAPHPDRMDTELPRFDPGRTVRAGIPALAISGTVASSIVPSYGEKARALAQSDAVRSDFPLAAEGVAKVTLKADVVREKGVAHNVLGLLKGTASQAKDRLVVVGAHFDHLGQGGSGSLAPKEYGQVHNGADDNASGTAVVLELARRWKASPPAGDVLIALWSGEELGLLGSAHWVEQPTVPLERVAANLNLDMVGRAGNGQCNVLGVGTSPAFESWMEEASRASGLVLVPSLSGAALGGSDHQSFLKKGIPALHLFTGLHADYHRPSDDTERVDAEGCAQVVELALELVQRMFAAEQLAFVDPATLSGASEDRPRRGRWSVRFGSMPDYAYEGQGLKLSGTSPEGPAERAGLMTGDVIVRVGEVQVTSIHDFMYALQIYKPGDVVLTRFLRDGEEQFVRVTLETAGE